MHILDECRKHNEMVCPRCERVVKAHQYTIKSNTEATVLFICGCGFSNLRRIIMDLAVDQIE